MHIEKLGKIGIGVGIADVSDFISCQKIVERLIKKRGLIPTRPQKEGKLLVPVGTKLDPEKIRENEENIMACEKHSRGRLCEVWKQRKNFLHTTMERLTFDVIGD